MAISGKYRLCQSFLGDKPPQDRSAADLVEAIRRTVGTLFFSLGSNFQVWSTISSYEPVTTFGAESAVTLDEVEVDLARMQQMFVTGVAELEPLFKSILTDTTLLQLQRIAALELDTFRYPANLWARTAFEFAASYQRAVISRDHIVQALVPLYRGRALSFLLENRDATADDMEKDVESLCGEFERSKPHLLELWADRK